MDYLALARILDPILEGGPMLLIVLAFTLIGLVAHFNFVRAVRSGLMVAVGFSGVYILVDHFLAQLAPAAQALALRFGGAFPYTDNGWRIYDSFAFGWPATYGVVVICLLVNLLMLLFSMTDTLNLNMHAYWMTGIAALIVTLLSGSLAAGLVFASFLAWLSLMLSDFFAQRGYSADLGLEGLTLYLGGGALWGVCGHYLGWLLERIHLPARAETHTSRDRSGLLGQPALLGAILALLLGIGAGYYWVDIVLLVISLATSLTLIPLMTALVRQALAELRGESGAILTVGKRGRRIWIGVDPAVAVGEPAVLATAVLMVPILIAISFIIPGAVSLPFADLAALVFFWVFAAATQHCNLPRTLLTATLMALFGVFASVRGVACWSDLVARNAGVLAPLGMGITAWFNHLSPEMLAAGLLGEQFDRIGMYGIIAFCAFGMLVTAAFRLNYLRKRAKPTGLAESMESKIPAGKT